MLSIVPKHKGTDKLRAMLRTKIAKLKSTTQKKQATSKHGPTYNIKKSGAGQVVIVGPANVGKSALVALTNANPEVADFPHSTWKPVPGMLQVENIQIQLIDTPPLGSDYVEPELMDLIRRSDLILLVVDLQTDPVTQLEDSVTLLQEHRIVPFRFKDRYSEPQGLTFIPFLILANKNDDANTEENYEIFCELLEGDWNLISASVTTGRNLELLKETLLDLLNIIRVYSKSPGKKPDLTSPFVLKKGSTMAEKKELISGSG